MSSIYIKYIYQVYIKYLLFIVVSIYTKMQAQIQIQVQIQIQLYIIYIYRERELHKLTYSSTPCFDWRSVGCAAV